MAEDTATETHAPAPAHAAGAGWNKKFLHVPLWGWAMGAGGLAAVGWYWWRHRKGGSTTTNATSNTVPVSNCRDVNGNVTPCTGCTDSNGNTVPCTSGGSGAGGGEYGYGNSGSGGGGSVIYTATPGTSTPPQGTSRTTTSPTTGKPPTTSKPTPPPTVKKYAKNPPSGFKGTPDTTSIKFSWDKQSSPATGFQLTVYDGATLKADDTFPNSSTGTTIGGLRPSNTYHCKLRGLPQQPGSFGSSITVKTKAAAKANPGGPKK